jgi:peptidoglycan/xylan/chitin deacetylase (PgdA/CDA1 family)
MTDRASKLLLTTSWDDGHPLAFRVAELLERHGLTGTFYVPRRSQREVMTSAQLLDLSSRFEIGSHTIDHVRLHLLPDDEVRRQLHESREWIENITGRQCRMFCFPGGKFRRRQLRLVAEAGFVAARTVELLSLGKPIIENGVRLIPTTVQAYPHPWTSYARNALRRNSLSGFFHAGHVLFARDWLSLGIALFQRCLEIGGVFHLWGHCWELEEEKQWDKLEEFFSYLSKRTKPWQILSNSGLCRNGL